MKKVEIEGKPYMIPDWVNWVAKNAEGEWCGFEEEPLCKWIYGFWKNQGSREEVTILQGTPLGEDQEEIYKHIRKV